MIDSRLLSHFAALMRHGSFKSAADELGISQSTITKSIAKLEDQIQLRLFNRTTRSVEPTDSARRLLVSAETTLQAAQVFTDEARLLSGGELGTLRVAIIALASEIMIADVLAYLSQHNPQLEIDIVVGSADIYRDLATGECDVAIGDEANFSESAHAQSLRMLPLNSEPIVLVHHEKHPSADDFNQLLQYPLALPSRYYNENRLFQTFRSQGGPERARYRLNNLSSCLALAARTDNITLAPASALAGSALPLVAAPYELNMHIQLAMVSLAAHSPTPAIRAFRSALRQSLGPAAS